MSVSAVSLLFLSLVGAADVLESDCDEQASITALIAQFRADDFDSREAAQANLAAMGTRVIPLLKQAASESDDPEVIWRCAQTIPAAEYAEQVSAACESRDMEKILALADSARLACRPEEVRRICRIARKILEENSDDSESGQRERERWEYRIGDQLTYAAFGPNVYKIDDEGPKFKQIEIFGFGPWVPSE